jgi:voltage-gated potassium channel
MEGRKDKGNRMKRFFWTIFQPSKLAMAVSLCFVILLSGTTGYMLIDNYPFLDAFYMSVITISTVGYGEVNPLSEQGRIFTTFLILTGFATLGFAGHAIVESLLEKVWSGDSEMKKMRKKIDKFSAHYIICGFGRVGDVASMQLKRAGVDFLVVEFSAEQCQLIKEHGFPFVEGDATREDVLLESGIKRASGLLALLDSDPKNLFIVLTARELNPTLHIISRSEDKITERKILRAGADSVISPHATAGRQIADDLLAATGQAVFLPEESTGESCPLPQWVTVHEGSSMLGRTIADISKEMGQDVLGLRRRDRDMLQPDPAIILEVDDILLILDVTEEGESDLVTKEIVPRKVVIVDDNPVIVRLYSRLFQKAGFHPICADNGEDGLNLIFQEKPEAAVVDLMLPGCSGIDVCRAVRNSDVGKDIRLILFTSDEEKETRDKAIEAGADKVVVKSPEASEVIEQVIQLLQKK